MLKFFIALCLLLVCFQAITANPLASSGPLNLATSDMVLDISVSDQGVLGYTYHFTSDPDTQYTVTLKSLFEVAYTNDDEVTIQPSSNYDLSKLTWSSSPSAVTVSDDGMVVPFNYTGSATTGAPFNYIILANRLQNPVNATDSKTYPTLKFDVVIDGYKFVNTSSRLAISLILSSTTKGTFNDVQQGKKDVSYRFGDGYIAINKSATAYPSSGKSVDVDVEIISPTLNSSKIAGAAEVWIVYENFPSDSKLVHDPEFGFGSGPGGISLILIIIIIAVIVVVIIAIIIVAMMIVRRRRRNAYAQF